MLVSSESSSSMAWPKYAEAMPTRQPMKVAAQTYGESDGQ